MRQRASSRARSLTVIVAITMLAACDDSTSAGGTASVRLASPAVAGLSSATSAGLSIAGSNGTLLISDIKLVVDEFKLKRAGASTCDDGLGPDSDDCEEFETNLFAADVPLGTGAVTIASAKIPAGSYSELDFDLKDLFVDPSDPDDSRRAARIAVVLAELRQSHPDWPAGASMMVAGTFTPTGGSAQPFRAYFDAAIEVEREFATPLVIGDGSAGVTIDLRPDIWFKNANGTVRNLALSNYATTNTLVEFELEFEEGIVIEFD
ncbi:MAG: hypothetical protein ACYC0B_03700 [Gemmatimonadaceae bacterium]